MNNKFCPNCGVENKNDKSVCEKCGMNLKKKTTEVSNNIPKKSTKETKAIAFASFFLYFGGGFVLPYFFQSIKGTNLYNYLFPLMVMTGIILIIYGRIRYPKDKDIKFVFLFVIISTIAVILYFIIMSILLYAMCWYCIQSID